MFTWSATNLRENQVTTTCLSEWFSSFFFFILNYALREKSFAPTRRQVITSARYATQLKREKGKKKEGLLIFGAVRFTVRCYSDRKGSIELTPVIWQCCTVLLFFGINRAPAIGRHWNFREICLFPLEVIRFHPVVFSSWRLITIKSGGRRILWFQWEGWGGWNGRYKKVGKEFRQKLFRVFFCCISHLPTDAKLLPC